MTDRELLELAAKAAGIELWHEDVFTDGLTQKISDNAVLRWDPIAKDGDALQLMVSLCLEPRFLDNSHSNGAELSRVTLHNVAGIVENIDGDPLAATRRAIVRAAAEIGRQMP